MLILSIRHASTGEVHPKALEDLCAQLPSDFRPLIRPTLEIPANVLGVRPEILRRKPLRGRSIQDDETPIAGEIFTNGKSLFALSLTKPRSQRARFRESSPTPDEIGGRHTLWLYHVGSDLHSESALALEKSVNTAFGVLLEPYFYRNPAFERLKSEGREPPSEPDNESIDGSVILKDRNVRSLAISIKASGGLLVRDLSKQLPNDARHRTDEIQQKLLKARLIAAEIVVICKQTQAQGVRIGSREALEKVSSEGLKCSCGRPIAQELVEEALTITDRGRELLDGSKWFTVLLLEELKAAGVPLERILIEQKAGGDEMDILADISGELALFELKDKEFNLGNAYSFGAKIGIFAPQYPVIVTTEKVGNDAKEHFQRARLTRDLGDDVEMYPFSPDGFPERTFKIKYIEGMDNLRSGLRELTTTIYSSDAARALQGVLSLGLPDARSVLRAIDSTGSSEST